MDRLKDRTFGIEIECFLNQDKEEFVDNFNSINSDLRNNQEISYLPNEYGTWRNDKWVLGYDGTVRPTGSNQRHAVELTSNPIIFSKIDNIVPIVKKLNDAGATVNKNCGFHCHIDAKDLSLKEVKKVMIAYLIYEEVIAFMNPYS